MKRNLLLVKEEEKSGDLSRISDSIESVYDFNQDTIKLEDQVTLNTKIQRLVSD